EPVLEGSAVRRRVAEVAFLEHIPTVCFGDCGGASIPDKRREASRDAIRVHAPNERGHLGVGLPRGALGGVGIRYRRFRLWFRGSEEHEAQKGAEHAVECDPPPSVWILHAGEFHLVGECERKWKLRPGC